MTDNEMTQAQEARGVARFWTSIGNMSLLEIVERVRQDGWEDFDVSKSAYDAMREAFPKEFS
jgi:hypothetical protein